MRVLWRFDDDRRVLSVQFIAYMVFVWRPRFLRMRAPHRVACLRQHRDKHRVCFAWMGNLCA